MALDFASLSPQELLAAEPAVLTMRSLMDAVATAPHGHGMACVESALNDQGFAHLRAMLQAAVASHAEAQKKMAGAASPVRAAGPRRSGAARTRRS